MVILSRDDRVGSGPSSPFTAPWCGRTSAALAAKREAQLDLGEDFPSHDTVNVGQAEVSASVAIGQRLVVQPHEVQDRCM